jgi:hypothetical protein
VRRAPYPFKGMLAISNDVDRMTMAQFRELHRYINTVAETRFGPGLGLDYADSFWVFSPPHRHDRHVALVNGCAVDADTPNAPELAKYIHAGWVDSLHSLGDFSDAYDEADRCTRAHGERALDLFRRWNIKATIWTNHGNANNVQNVGRKTWMLGGQAASACDLTDILPELGVRFLNWQGKSSSIEAAVEPEPSNPPYWRFNRYYTEDAPANADPSLPDDAPAMTVRDGVIYLWHPQLLDRQVSDLVLERIAATGGHAIAAQHMGAGYLRRPDFPVSALAALRRLRDYQDRGEVLVTRTSRLLHYAWQLRVLNYAGEWRDGRLSIDVLPNRDSAGETLPTVEDLRGVTFQAPAGAHATISIGGVPVAESAIRRARKLGEECVGFAWHAPDTSDYTVLD